MNWDIFDAAARFTADEADREKAFRFAQYFGENASDSSNVREWWWNFEAPALPGQSFDRRTVRV